MLNFKPLVAGSAELCKLSPDNCLVTNQKLTESRSLFEKAQRSRDHHGCAVVSAHHIKSNSQHFNHAIKTHAASLLV